MPALYSKIAVMPYSQVDQHAHDIAYAVFRVASLVRHPKLKSELENAAIDLIARVDLFSEGAGGRGIESHTAIRRSERLRWLVQLTESVGEMKPINSAVLQREIRNFQSAIADLIGKVEIELGAKEFTALGAPKAALEAEKKNEPKAVEPAAPVRTEVKTEKTEEKVIMLMPAKTENVQKETVKKQVVTKAPEKKEKTQNTIPAPKKAVSLSTGSEMSGAIRQGAVMDAIRQMPGGCRMRDLVTMFPNVSERTLRNDLQALVKQGSVERFGSQGPYSYFRAVTHGEVFAL